MPKGYVVYFCERLRDGREEGARIVNTKEEAIDFINKIRGSFAGSNYEFGLYELGKQIPITTETVEEPQPSVKTTKYKLK